MFNLQGSEIIFILLLALVILGPEKLPGAIRRFTRTYAELRKMGTGFQNELKSALDEPMREVRETADLLRDTADPAKIAADAEAEAEKQAADEKKARAEQATTDADETASENTVGGPAGAESQNGVHASHNGSAPNGTAPPSASLPAPDAAAAASDLAPPDRFADPVDEIAPPSPLPAPDPGDADSRTA
ncbi:MAG: hypothetical protein AAGD33_15860 [Actinomycetota bacterium]